jgi:hemoglobin
MELTINTFEFGERPSVTLPSPLMLELLKEEGMRQMVSDHYDLLHKSEIKHLFPADEENFKAAKQRSADFFIQICGGPPYFNINRGKPVLAARHAPFAITPEARIIWLSCYKAVLVKLTIPEEVIVSYWNYLNYFSNWMVNTQPQTENTEK